MEKRMLMTEEEKMAQDVLGTDGITFNMGEHNIDKMFELERARKFNSQVDQYAERLLEHIDKLKESTDTLGDIEDLEIKPMFNRILIVPFKQNPFLRIKIENGLITDLGGLAPQYKNMDNGRIEEMEQMIITGEVYEVGPEVKYITPGDVIMYRKETAMPVPFFKQGLMCIAETLVISVVAKYLLKRFDDIKNNN